MSRMSERQRRSENHKRDVALFLWFMFWVCVFPLGLAYSISVGGQM